MPFRVALRRVSVLRVPVVLAALLALASLWGILHPGSALANSQTPIAAYSFDEEATAGEDVTGNEHEATIEGAKWAPAGRYGSALEFDGENDCVSIPNTGDLQLDEEFTLEAWVRPAAGHEFAPIFFKEVESKSFYSYSMFLGVEEYGHLEGFVASGTESEGWEEVASKKALPTNTWSHVAFTSDGANLRLYVNGELADTAEAGVIGKSEGSLYLGCWPDAGQHYKGKMDEVRVYDRASSGQEILDDRGSGLETPPSSPVATYSFDEDEGTVADDYAGGHDGAVEGATWTRGKFGSALEFAKEEDCVSIPNSEDLQLSEEFTLEAWVKPTNLGSDEPIVLKETPGWFGYSLFLGLDTSGHLEGYIGEEGEDTRGTEGPILANKNAWSHVALTFDGAEMRLFVNGELVDASSAEGPMPTTGQLSIGCSKNGKEHFAGKIDEVRIDSRALSQGELASDMNIGIHAPSEAPIAAYSFDEESKTVAEDLTGNGHEGTIENAKWTPAGRYGGALDFNGESSCVTTPNTEDLQLDEEFTLEAWVRPTPGQSFVPIFFKEVESKSFYSYSMFLGVNETGHIEGFVANGGEAEGWEEVVSKQALPGNTWSHVAFTSDGAHLRLYVNGELVDTANAGAIGESEGPLALGCWPGGGEYYEGKIDEVRAYNRALSGQEILNDRGTGIQTTPAGPVASYAFDENEGTVAHDDAGGHDATIEGATWTHGKFGSALDFTSAEEHVVTIPTSPELDLEDFTLEAWVKPSEIHRFDPVIAKTPSSSGAYGYELMAGGAEPSALPEGFITQGESVHRYTYSEHQLEKNAWTHIAVTSDGNVMRYFVNGELFETHKGDNVLAGGEAPLQIGGNNSFASPAFFDGKIDEVRIYNRALSEDEVSADMNTGIETPQKDPIAAYDFDAEEGSTLEDITGSGHEGTIEGATWTPHGKYGGALEFDGVNDCISVPHSSEFEFLEDEEFTLEAWVRPEGENVEGVVTQEDNSPEGEEEPFSYSMLDGGTEEGPKGWLRKGGEVGHAGVQAPDSLPRNAWSHIAVTDDGSRYRIYVNGEHVGTTIAIPLTAADGALTIGCIANYGNYFRGRIDDLKIYNRSPVAAPDDRGPAINISGPLATAPEGWISQEEYGLEANASDQASGVTHVAVALDGILIQSKRDYCIVGGCDLAFSAVIDATSLKGGAHALTVLAEDSAGNVSRADLTLNVNPKGIATVSNVAAALRAAEKTGAPTTVGPAIENDVIDGSAPDLRFEANEEGFKSKNTTVPLQVFREASSGFTASVFNTKFVGFCTGNQEEEEEAESPQEELCENAPVEGESLVQNLKLQPSSTGSSATDMTLIGRASLAANTHSEEDTLLRPLADGGLVYLVIRGTEASGQASWSLDLAKGQHLELVNSHHVTLLDEEGLAVATLVAEPARDAIGKAVSTQLSVSEENRLSLKVEPPGSAVFPIVAGVGLQAGTFHVTAEGPHSPTELQKENERVKKEEKEIKQKEEEGKLSSHGPNFRGAYTTLTIKRFGPPVAGSSSSVPSHEFEFSHCNYGGIEIPSTEEKPPWGIDPERKGASKEELAFLTTVGICIKDAPDNHVEDAERVIGRAQVMPHQEVWISEDNRKHLKCHASGPNKPLLRHCYVKPSKSKTGITVGGNYRYFSEYAFTTCLTVFGHLNTIRPFAEAQEAIETFAGSTNSSAPSKCEWPEE